MMELAGFHMVGLFQELKISKRTAITIVCGIGNKGGDGLCAARHLTNAGYEVRVVLMSRDISPDAKHQMELLERMKVDQILFADNEEAEAAIRNSAVIIDALIGYNLKGAPRGDVAEAIWLMNGSGSKIISYDLPTGADPSSGTCHEPCLSADVTLTLAMPKRIFNTESGKAVSGDIYLADIGIPSFLYNHIKANSRPNFKGGLVKL